MSLSGSVSHVSGNRNSPYRACITPKWRFGMLKEGDDGALENANGLCRCRGSTVCNTYPITKVINIPMFGARPLIFLFTRMLLWAKRLWVQRGSSVRDVGCLCRWWKSGNYCKKLSETKVSTWRLQLLLPLLLWGVAVTHFTARSDSPGIYLSQEDDHVDPLGTVRSAMYFGN